MSSSWTKETALAEIQMLADYTYELAKYYPFCAEHTRWVARTLAVLEEVFGGRSRYFLTMSSYNWLATGSFVLSWLQDINQQVQQRHQQGYLLQLESARGLRMAAIDHLQRKDLADVYDGTDTAPESNAIMKLINLAEHSLHKVLRAKPNHEGEVQDAFEGLLVGANVPYKRETERVEYSSKTYTPDFTVPRINLAIELKLCNRQGREKEIIAEMNDDILAYGTKFANLLFVVYDLGFVRDVDRFIRSFENNQNLVVRVVKH
jgi:hypothetical protein